MGLNLWRSCWLLQSLYATSLGLKQALRKKRDLNGTKCSVVDHNPDMPSPTAAEPLDGELILLLARLA